MYWVLVQQLLRARGGVGEHKRDSVTRMRPSNAHLRSSGRPLVRELITDHAWHGPTQRPRPDPRPDTRPCIVHVSARLQLLGFDRALAGVLCSSVRSSPPVMRSCRCQRGGRLPHWADDGETPRSGGWPPAVTLRRVAVRQHAALTTSPRLRGRQRSRRRWAEKSEISDRSGAASSKKKQNLIYVT